MRIVSLKQIESKLERFEKHNSSYEWDRFRGRYYDELTDEEKEQYLEYTEGKNHISPEIREQVYHFLYPDEQEFYEKMHVLCEIKPYNPKVKEKIKQSDIDEVEEILKPYEKEGEFE